MKLIYPVDLKEVVKFLDQRQSAYVASLKAIRHLVDEAIAATSAREAVYKIYSRSESQVGEELKTPGKCRLKADKHCRDNNPPLNEYDMYAMPDIVGFRVVVLFPSDINTIAEGLDKAIDQGGAFAMYGKPSEERIKTKWGRASIKDGYHACHYNLKTEDHDRSPIVEVQLLTVLHDAWGAKTHNLTYKPQGRIDALISKHVDALGDSLAGLDWQSDLLRATIRRSARAGENKKRKVQVVAAVNQLKWAKSLEKIDNALALQIDELEKSLFNFAANSPREEIQVAKKGINKLFDLNPRIASSLALLAAVKTGHSDLQEFALEQLYHWEAKQTELYQRILIASHRALFCYSFGDLIKSIEYGEDAYHTLLNNRAMLAERNERLPSFEISLTSTLAYYFAEAIGSDYGKKRDASAQCRKYLDLALDQLVRLTGANSEGSAIDKAASLLQKSDKYAWLPEAIDNLTYCEMCCADTAEQVNSALEVLSAIAAQPNAAGLSEELRTSYVYHRHCGLRRLMELEADGA